MPYEFKSERHAGGFRGFSILTEAYYADSALGRADYEEEIMVGIYHEEHDGHSTSGEFSLRWHRLGGKDCLLVNAFEDALQVAFVECRDLIDELAKLDNTNPQPSEIVELLKSLGFVDKTIRKAPWELFRNKTEHE